MNLHRSSTSDHTFFAADGRALLVERLAASLARLAKRDGVVVVVALGIDRMSQINDTWGYEIGDRFLAEVNARLANCCTGGEEIARVGGDQFVLVREVPEGEDVEAELAKQVIRAIFGSYTIGQHVVYVTASVGVAGSAEPSDPEALLSAAESARAEAHRRGGRRWVRSDPLMRIRVQEQLRTEQSLHGAIENDELDVHYQPVLELASGTTTAFEALTRWHSPLAGDIPPLQFIPRAEETGLIVPMGHWVLDEVVRHFSTRESVSDSASAPAIAVNISAIQFRLDLDALVHHLVEASDALPGQLWVEITESMLLEDADGVRATIQDLKSLGLQLLIDDFGTGYSSLSQLRLVPVDAIKIDRAFVGRIHESPRDRAIVQAMIQLAHTLGIFAVAEGVETEQQLDALHELSCDYAQGFLFSPAVPFERLKANLAEGEAPWSSRLASQKTANPSRRDEIAARLSAALPPKS